MIEPSEDRIRLFKSNTRDEYERYSQVRKIVSPGESQSEELEFVQIGSRFHVPPEVLVTPVRGPDVAPNIVGLGQSIAIGEMNYLLKQLRMFVSNRDHAEEISFDTLMGLLARFDLHNPRSVLVPLYFYSALHLGKHAGMFVDYHNYDPYLVLGFNRIPIYWSNNYVPFDEFIFVGSDLGRWVIKPDPRDGNPLTIEVQGIRSGKIDVIVKTVACFAHGNSKAGLILKVSPSKKPKSPLVL